MKLLDIPFQGMDFAYPQVLKKSIYFSVLKI